VIFRDEGDYERYGKISDRERGWISKRKFSLKTSLFTTRGARLKEGGYEDSDSWHRRDGIGLCWASG
jgi:hypothetical protein